jgi:metal-responsive CopG/Arc/MetJ family transcriptional regulator
MQVKANLPNKVLEEMDRIRLEKPWLGYESRAEVVKDAVRDWILKHRKG